VLVSAFALTPIESAAFAYQLADFKTIDRRAGRFLDLKFFSFCLSSFDVMRPTFTLVRTKHLLLQLNNRRLIDRRRIGNKNNRPWKRQKVNIFNLATGSDRTSCGRKYGIDLRYAYSPRAFPAEKCSPRSAWPLHFRFRASETGASRREAAERFEVSASSAVKWMQRDRVKHTLAQVQRTRFRHRSPSKNRIDAARLAHPRTLGNSPNQLSRDRL
jgi:hypothetical protein